MLQGNDFLHLFDEYHCVLEIGGSDQWGNLTSGLDLIHKVRGVDVNVFTSPIITDAQGKKFGKSEATPSGWMARCSALQVLPVWFNRPDSEMENLLKAFTFLPKAEIERLIEESKTNPGAREAQRTLAWEVTSFVHGEEATRQAIEAAGALFGRGGDLADIDESTLEAAIDGMKVDGEFAKVAAGDRVAEAGMKAGLFKSISEARKTIKSGGVYLNNTRVEDEEQTLQDGDFLHGRFVLIRRGKKALGVVEQA